MRASSLRNLLILTLATAFSIALGSSTAWADFPNNDPDPPQLPEPPDPNDHTAQDGGEPEPPPEDHTAQDDDEPTNNPPLTSGKEKWKSSDNREDPYTGKIGRLMPKLDDGQRFDAPLVELLDLSTSDAPDAKSMFDGTESLDPIAIHRDDYLRDQSGTAQYTHGAVPTPGVLVIIGAGALALRRRRRG